VLAKEHPDQDKKWEEKLKIPGMTYFLKKGGSDQNSNQPYFRVEF